MVFLRPLHGVVLRPILQLWFSEIKIHVLLHFARDPKKAKLTILAETIWGDHMVTSSYETAGKIDNISPPAVIFTTLKLP